MVSLSKKLFIFGIVFLFLNLLLSVKEEYSMIICYSSMTIMLTGIMMNYFYLSNFKEIGSIVIEKDNTIFNIDGVEKVLINSKFKVRFSDNGYRGQLTSPFRRLGSLSYNNGINRIKMYNDIEWFNFEFVIENKHVYKKIVQRVNKNYKK